jgi:pimeloyl-ACP methyl ester carboxylesterase
VLDILMRVAGTRPPSGAIRRGIGHGIDPQLLDRVVREFTRESPRLYRDPVTTGPWQGARGYVIARRDRELPHNRQRTFARAVAAQWIEELDTGHLPMLEAPDALARSLCRFLKRHVDA